MTIEHFPPRGGIERVIAAVLRGMLKALLKPAFSARVPIPWQRRWLGVLSKLSLVPPGSVFEAATLGGVPGEWVRPALPPTRPGTLLYLHGGAYCIGAPATHRALTARLAGATGMAVFAADYRLAPEHPFPAAVDDALAAYRALPTTTAPWWSAAIPRAAASRWRWRSPCAMRASRHPLRCSCCRPGPT